MLLLLGLTGWLVNDAAVQQNLVDALASTFPPLAELFEGILASISNAAALTSVVGFIGLIWAVSQFYGALDVAFARIYSDAPERDIFRRTTRGFAWVALLIGAVVVVIVAGSLATLLDAFIPDEIPVASTISGILTSPIALIVASVVVVMILYKVMPPKAPSWWAIRPPAIVVGIALVVFAQIFLFIVPRLVGSVAFAGSLAAAFIALAWLSFSFQALLYGAAWVRIRDERRSGVLGRPAAPAEPGGGGE
jgi:uncharacterized BrkB/YihY/UPF0761 family membrane protein